MQHGNRYYFEKERIFKLDTPNSSYVIGIVDKENFVGHVYYGKKLKRCKHRVPVRVQEKDRLCLQKITGSVFLFTIHFRWSMPETDWEITEEAVSR